MRKTALNWLLTIGWCVLAGHAQASDDWPTYQQNNRRNAVALEHLDPAEMKSMSLQWRWTSPAPPHPAWYGPAKWDAYAELRGLKSMRNYDSVFHAVAAEDLVYFGSSADDSVHCLYAQTGQTKWIFTTDAPVRVPPTVWQQRVYFGSDDGHVYCLSAGDGSLIWKYRPAPIGKRILQDGRLISTWPCRSGVTVDDGVAYFTASLLPWNDAYLCAVDAKSGQVANEQHFVRRVENATMEAPVALSATHIIVPQGRVAPMLFSRSSGERLGSLQGGGGSFVVLSADQIFHGPGNKTGWITGSNPQTRDVIANLKGAHALVIDGRFSYLLKSDECVATEFKAKKLLWRTATDCTFSLMKAGEVLLLGGRNQVCAIAAASGKPLWEHQVEGVAHGLAMAGGKLFVSTDNGSLYAFAPSIASAGTSPAEKRRAPSADANLSASGALKTTLPADYHPAVGPWLQFESPYTARVQWGTSEPAASVVELAMGGEVSRIANEAQTTQHSVELTRLPHHDTFHYRICSGLGQSSKWTGWIEVDTLFNYEEAAVKRPLGGASAPVNDPEQIAKSILPGGAQAGVAVVMGLRDGSVVYELLRQSSLRIIAFDTDQQVVSRIRTAFLDAGIYGTRFSCHHVDAWAHATAIGDFADFVTSEALEPDTLPPAAVREAWRIAKPGGTIRLCAWDSPGAEESHRALLTATAAAVQLEKQDGVLLATAAKPLLKGSGQWSHIYGTASNALYGGERLGLARQAGDLDVQWIGRPGPRFQPDRNGRKPPPLSAGGRLFHQGLQRMIAVNQYNGAVLWSLEIPDLARFNIPRDCGNWCADQHAVFAAVRDRCWVIDADTGEVTDQHSMPVESLDESRLWSWGYLARTQDLMIGSSVAAEAPWKSFWGKSGWYDSERGEATHKICSDQLFAMEMESGSTVWTYRSGVIINPTITTTDKRVYFLECRNPAVIDQPLRRIGGNGLWEDLYLVALDCRTGKVTAEQRLSIVGGQVACYLAHCQQALVLVSSAAKQYHVYAYSPESCAPLWNTSFPWGKGKADHGSHLSRPAIVADTLFVRPAVLNVATGERLPLTMPVGGCGTYAATDAALFYRAGSGKNTAVWDSRQGAYTNWSRLRPDCWLSTIPAGGMLLSPEGGGGCSCGSWMETSLGFMPIRQREAD